MLVLSRRVHETLVINGDIRITVVRVSGSRVRLGVEAPENVKVVREELLALGGAGPEAGEPRSPHSPDGRETDVEPVQDRSRGEPRGGQGLRLPRSPGTRPCRWSPRNPHRQGLYRSCGGTS
jgi:carbon storage regulator